MRHSKGKSRSNSAVREVGRLCFHLLSAHLEPPLKRYYLGVRHRQEMRKIWIGVRQTCAFYLSVVDSLWLCQRGSVRFNETMCVNYEVLYEHKCSRN